MENNKKEDRMPNANEYVDKEGHIRSFDTLEVRGIAFVEELLDAMRKKKEVMVQVGFKKYNCVILSMDLKRKPITFKLLSTVDKRTYMYDIRNVKGFSYL